jgi:hypothetical protein
MRIDYEDEDDDEDEDEGQISKAHSSLSKGGFYATLLRVNRLTRQEQLVLCVILGLLLTGWVVKAYRLAHPPAQAVTPVKS